MFPNAPAFDRAPTPVALAVNPRGAAAFGAVVLAALLLGLFVYRRRPYILQWTAGWMLVAAAMALLAREWASAPLGRAIVGLSHFLHVLAALTFVLSADSFRQRPRIKRRDIWYLVPILLWFVLAPVALGIKAVLLPGYLLTAGSYTAAAVAYFLLLKRTRLVGAGAVGGSFLLLAVLHAWLLYDGAIDAQAWDQRALAALMPAALLSLAAVLGMHVLVFEDITWELRKTNRRLEAAHGELEQLVITDALTGCYNRRFFGTIIARELQRASRYGTPLSILFVDVDRFKAVNDTLGHAAGDAALRRVAEFLRANVREADYLFRWGGDEFVVLIACNHEEASSKARELSREFAASIAGESYPEGFGLSIGTAEVSPDDANAAAAIKEADGLMYKQKTRVLPAGSAGRF